MYRFFVFFFVSFIATTGICQQNREVIMTIDKHPILKEEFVRLYRKNNDHLINESEKKTPKEYLNLFVNFKLKVLEAERLKYDTIPSFINELKSYRDELAKPYLTSVHYTNQMVKTAYERMQTEISASHILFRLNENALPEDTLKVWNKLIEIRNELLDGADFGQLAIKYSQDPSAKNNKGSLGYFSAFQMVYPFESAAYNTPVGEISMPVRTSFGYHLIKVNDKREAKGQIKVAHIMKRLASNSSEEIVSRQKQEIDSIAQELKKGADFAKLASTYSDDKRSASNGGELSWFSSSDMMPEFAAPAFALKNDGDLSPVIRTPYGWHIIKRIEYRPLQSYDELKDFLADKIRKNPAISKYSKKIFINKIKEAYRYKLNEKTYTLFTQEAKLAFSNGHFTKIDVSKPASVIFSFADQQITNHQFAVYLENTSIEGDQTNIETVLNQQYEDFVAETLTKYEDTHLEEKYPDFKYLTQEYHDGILLFNISEDKIWNAAVKDSLGLQSFYEKNKKKYFWDERFKGWSIKCNQQETKDFIEAIFEADPQIDEKELNDQLIEHFGETNDEIASGYFEKGTDALIDYLVWNSPKPEGFVDGLHFVRGNKIGPEAKILTEAKGLYVSDYQNKLEENWLKELHKKYKVKVNKKALKSIDSIK